MKALAYIVSERKLRNIKGFVEVVDDISKADLTKPTLLAGFELAKKHISNFNILEKKVNDNLFWTFGRYERRKDHEDDIEKFYKYVINRISSKIKYFYVNPMELRYNRLKRFVEIVFSKKRKYIYNSDGMLYLLYGNNILGVSLSVLEYMHVNTDKILERINKNENNIICTDSSECVESIKSEIINKKYVVPYFMQLLL